MKCSRPGPVAQQADDFFERRHGDEAVDAVMVGGFEPRLGVAGGEQVAVEVDDRPVHLRPRHRAAEVDARAVVLRLDAGASVGGGGAGRSAVGMEGMAWVMGGCRSLVAVRAADNVAPQCPGRTGEARFTARALR